jgi:hypothetical protein
MSRPTINANRLLWSGQHWVNYIRKPGDEADSARVSLYHTHYSPVGEGTMAFVDIPGADGFSAICTDNGEMVKHLLSFMRHPFDPNLPVVSAAFERTGDITREPSWRIETEGAIVTATWKEIQRPLVVEGWAPYFREDRDLFTILFFCDDASIECNGKAVEGKPYERDIWSSSIGDLRSSCVFALSETILDLAAV